jgi:hypothetical protein
MPTPGRKRPPKRSRKPVPRAVAAEPPPHQTTTTTRRMVAELTIMIDDDRLPPEGVVGWKIARTLQRGLELLDEHKGQCFDLWLDYHLAPYVNTGEVIERLVAAAQSKQPYHISTIYIHTADTMAARAMMAILSESGYHIQRAYLPENQTVSGRGRCPVCFIAGERTNLPHEPVIIMRCDNGHEWSWT